MREGEEPRADTRAEPGGRAEATFAEAEGITEWVSELRRLYVEPKTAGTADPTQGEWLRAAAVEPSEHPAPSGAGHAPQDLDGLRSGADVGDGAPTTRKVRTLEDIAGIRPVDTSNARTDEAAESRRRASSAPVAPSTPTTPATAPPGSTSATEATAATTGSSAGATTTSGPASGTRPSDDTSGRPARTGDDLHRVADGEHGVSDEAHRDTDGKHRVVDGKHPVADGKHPVADPHGAESAADEGGTSGRPSEDRGVEEDAPSAAGPRSRADRTDDAPTRRSDRHRSGRQRGRAVGRRPAPSSRRPTAAVHAPRDVDAPGTGPAGDGTGSSAHGHSLTDAEVSADHVSTADPAGGRAGRRAARRAEESRRLRRRRAVLVSLVLLGVVAVAGWWLVRPTSDTSAPVPALVDLVLAPLEDIGPGSPS